MRWKVALVALTLSCAQAALARDGGASTRRSKATKTKAPVATEHPADANDEVRPDGATVVAPATSAERTDFGMTMCWLFIIAAGVAGVVVVRRISRSVAAQNATGAGTADEIAIVSRYRGNCRTCYGTVLPGMPIFWRKGARDVRHQNCQAARREVEDEAVTQAIGAIEKAQGPVARRRQLDRFLASILDAKKRDLLLLAASRIEVHAVLDKVDRLKTQQAKRRHLEQAIAALRADDVPDDLQAQELRWLEDALRALDEDR